METIEIIQVNGSKVILTKNPNGTWTTEFSDGSSISEQIFRDFDKKTGTTRQF